jgi:hypothetical protein
MRAEYNVVLLNSQFRCSFFATVQYEYRYNNIYVVIVYGTHVM